MSTRARLWIGIGAFATALCLALGATVVVLFIGARAASQPSAVVSSYLSQVQRGHISSALRMEGRAANPAEVLLSDTAYRNATDRMTGFRVLSTQTTGASATVEARIQQKSGATTATFELRKRNGIAGLFGVDTWKLQPVHLGTVEVTLGAPGRIDATLGGVPLQWKGAVKRIHAFPGTYALDVKSQSPWFTLPSASAAVAGFGHDDRFQVPATLTQKGTDASIAAANAWLDACAAHADFHPPQCSFSLTSGADPGEVWTNQSWQVQTRPTLDIGAWDFSCRVPTAADVSAAGCWPVKTTTPGQVTFHADYSIPATGETGDITSTGPIDAQVEGWISSFTDTAALFTSVTWAD